MEENIVFPVVDETGRELKAEVIDMFSVEEYPDNDYLMYSFDNSSGDDVQVNISRAVVNEDGGLDFIGIEDETEWAAVNNAIDSMIENLGEA